MTTMTFTKQVAARERVKLMLGLTGPSGSGKTYSALQLAYGITGDWSKITLADTENKSALYYAGDKTGPWEHVDFSPDRPGAYSPVNFISLIEWAEKDPKTEVLIIDSISHEWEGAGGCLELVEAKGTGFAGWKAVTPLHRRFIDTMRNSRLHIIATMRSKTDYVVETNDRGKSAPKKVGTKSTQREGTDYEFGLIFDVEMSHYATASKDRTGLFANRGPFKISKETGAELLQWANSGVTPSEKIYSSHDVTKKHWLADQLAYLEVPKDRWKEISDALEGQPESQMEIIAAKVLGKI
jgi:hypothetical protein